MTTSPVAMPPRLNPKKLLLSKWTAAQPQGREKHFIVTKLLQPETATVPPAPPKPVVQVVIEAVHSGRSRTIEWRELTDVGLWRQGWR